MPTTTTTEPPLTVGSAFTGAYAAVTLHAFEFPAVGPEDAQRISTPGTAFAVADIEVCPTDGPVTVLEGRLHGSDNRQPALGELQHPDRRS